MKWLRGEYAMWLRRFDYISKHETCPDNHMIHNRYIHDTHMIHTRHTQLVHGANVAQAQDAHNSHTWHAHGKYAVGYARHTTESAASVPTAQVHQTTQCRLAFFILINIWFSETLFFRHFQLHLRYRFFTCFHLTYYKPDQ